MVDLLSTFISAFLGMIVTALLSPIIFERVIRFYSAIGLLQHDLSISASVTKNFYEEGIAVDKYDGTEWRSSYEILRLKTKNEGESSVYNIRTTISFLGFMEDFFVSESGTHDVSLESPDKKVEMFNYQDENVAKLCTQTLYVSQIDEHGEAVVEFIIDTDTSGRGAYAHFNPSKEIKGHFKWEAKGVRLSDPFAVEIRDDIGVYDDIQQPDDLQVKMDEYSSTDTTPDITVGVLDDPTENPLYDEDQDDPDDE